LHNNSTIYSPSSSIFTRVATIQTNYLTSTLPHTPTQTLHPNWTTSLHQRRPYDTPTCVIKLIDVRSVERIRLRISETIDHIMPIYTLHRQPAVCTGWSIPYHQVMSSLCLHPQYLLTHGAIVSSSERPNIRRNGEQDLRKSDDVV